MSEAGASYGAAGAETVRHEFADVNGVRIHYAIARPLSEDDEEPAELEGERKLIVFLHGFPEFWYAWRKQLDEFGRDLIAVAPDMRGYNLSSKPAAVGEYDIGKLVGDVRALVEYLAARQHLRAARCVLVGHDWGGIVAWATAMTCPEIVERLVIINAPHPKIFERELRDNPKQQEASQYMVMFRSPQAEGILSANNFAMLQETIFGDGIRQGYISEADRKAYLEAWSAHPIELLLQGGEAVGHAFERIVRGFLLRGRRLRLFFVLGERPGVGLLSQALAAASASSAAVVAAVVAVVAAVLPLVACVE